MRIVYEESYFPTQEDYSTHWFTVDGVSYALTSEGELLDSDGCPIEDCNDHDRVKKKLVDFFKTITECKDLTVSKRGNRRFLLRRGTATF